jgi:hypothetical protein
MEALTNEMRAIDSQLRALKRRERERLRKARRREELLREDDQPAALLEADPSDFLLEEQQSAEEEDDDPELDEDEREDDDLGEPELEEQEKKRHPPNEDYKDSLFRRDQPAALPEEVDPSDFLLEEQQSAEEEDDDPELDEDEQEDDDLGEPELEEEKKLHPPNEDYEDSLFRREGIIGEDCSAIRECLRSDWCYQRSTRSCRLQSYAGMPTTEAGEDDYDPWDSDEEDRMQRKRQAAKNKKRKREETEEELVDRVGEERAAVILVYLPFRRMIPHSDRVPGNTRQLMGPEKEYFLSEVQEYLHKPLVRLTPSPFLQPPSSWHERWAFHRSQVATYSGVVWRPQPWLHSLLSSTMEFAELNCRSTERQNWSSVLDPILQEESKFVLAAIFIKSTNGVGDANTCRHYREVVERGEYNQITIDDCLSDEFLVPRLCRRCSKWVKNTAILIKIFRDVKENCGGQFPRNYEGWLRYH